MTTQAVNDWIVQVGFDDSKVVSGSKRLQATMSRLAKIEKISESSSAASGKQALNNQKAIGNIESKRLRAQQLLFSLKKSGATDRELTTLQNRLNATKTIAGYNKVIQSTQEAILSARKREHELSQKQRAARAEEARVAKEQKLAAKAAMPGKTPKAPKEPPLEFSKVKLVDTVAVERQIIRLNELRLKAQAALAKVPQGAKFDFQRENLKGVISDLDKLKQAYRQAGTVTAYRNLSIQMDQLRNSTRAYVGQANQAHRVMNAQEFAAQKLKNSIQNLAASYLSVFAVIEGGQRFMQTGMEFESIDAQMLGVSSNLQQAGKDFDFVARQAIRLGSDLTESARSFAKFGTASVLSDFDPNATKKMYTQIMEVNRAFGLTKERQGLSFLALEQMLSKGTVSMEELRRQLGEQWPGAFSQAAKAMNMTGGELAKFIETGKLASADFLPKFLDQMNNFVRDNGMLEASMKKVGAAQGAMMTQLKLNIDAGFMAGRDGFHGFFKDLQLILRENTKTFKSFGVLFGATLKTVSSVLKGITPILTIVGNSFDTLRVAMERALNVNKDWADLTAIEAVFRTLGIVVGTVNLLLLYFGLYASQAAEFLGMSEEEASGFTKQLGALAVAMISMFAVFRVFRVLLTAALAPFKMLGWIGGKIRGLAGLGSKVSGKVAASTGARQASRLGGIARGAASTGARLLGPAAAAGMAYEGYSKIAESDIVYHARKLYEMMQANSQTAGRYVQPTLPQSPSGNHPVVKHTTVHQTNNFHDVPNLDEVRRMMEKNARQAFINAIDTTP